MPYHNPNQNVVVTTPSTTTGVATTTTTTSKPCTFADMNFIAASTVKPVYAQDPQGGMGGFSTFLNNMWIHYQSQGCSWWANRTNHWVTQLPSITHAYNAQLKTAKIAFGQQMHIKCGCSGTVPIVLGSTNTYAVNLTPGRGVLDNSSDFPPTFKYKIIITPSSDQPIQAAQYSNSAMLLSYEGSTNSHTKWPSRFQWTMTGSEEYPVFYKIVITDSTNPHGDTSWSIDDFPENEVYVWIYFGKNENTPIEGSNDLSTTISLDYNSALITGSSEIARAEDSVVDPEDITINTINTFKF